MVPMVALLRSARSLQGPRPMMVYAIMHTSGLALVAPLLGRGSSSVVCIYSREQLDQLLRESQVAVVVPQQVAAQAHSQCAPSLVSCAPCAAPVLAAGGLGAVASPVSEDELALVELASLASAPFAGASTLDLSQSREAASGTPGS